MQYQVLYDILTAPSIVSWREWTMVVFPAFVLTGVIWLVLLRPGPKGGRVVVGTIVGLWALVWLGLGGPAVGQALASEQICKEWMRKGDFQVTEGTLSDFKPATPQMPMEQFTVNGVVFQYFIYEMSGGFKGRSPRDKWEFKDGMRVRIAHKEGRILRLEADRTTVAEK